jgi:stage V sporulation protein AB
MAKKTNTEKFIKTYENAIMLGGIFGGLYDIVNYKLPIGKLFVCIFSFFIGVFYGLLAMSLAEILNVIPILLRRTKIKIGLQWLIFSIALGKLIGSIVYFMVSGFS